jgi:aquaporin Z
MGAALKEHWPEYLMEAAGLGIFMISVCVCDALLEQLIGEVPIS